MSETTTKPMSIAASFRNMWGIIAEAADRSRGQNADARYAAMFEAANKAQLWLATKSTLDALMNTCAKKDAEITKLKSQLEEARARVNELETGFSTGLAEIKDELNGLALMGAVPMWGSLIGRLDDLAVEVLNGDGKR